MEDKQREKAEEALRQKQEESRVKAEEEKLRAHERPQDVGDPRAKNTGHKKVTADKWNQ